MNERRVMGDAVTTTATRNGALAEHVTRSSLLAAQPGLVHGLTGRVPGLGRADGNIGYSAPRDAADAWEMRQLWCAALGLSPESLVTVHQIHGASVARARMGDGGRGARPGSEPLARADAIITDAPGITLLTLHADCLPILFYDPVRRAIAAIHAGWRGTVSDVAGATVSAMQEAFGTKPEDLIAYLGSAIRLCCYEVGEEVVAAWRDLAGDDWPAAAEQRGDRWRFDVALANAVLLRRRGVPTEQIEINAACTRCQGDRWFSHRGQGPDTGRFGAIIALSG